MKEKFLLLRSMMYVPGHNDRLLLSASKSMADGLFLDLEDSVKPDSNKAVARQKIKEFVEAGKFENHYVFPRVNDRESGFLLKDLQELTIDGVDGFLYPKALNGQDIYFFDKLLETIEVEKGFPIGTFKIMSLIETSSAVLNLQEICQASNRLIALVFGCEDFISDLEGIHDREGKSIFTPRALIALAARANNVIPIDTVHINVHDLADFERNLIVAKNLGFEGASILHPKELPLAHKYFSPSKEEVDDAEEMLKLDKEAQKENKGVAIKDGKFIGPPMVLSAKKTLSKHQLIQQKSKSE